MSSTPRVGRATLAALMILFLPLTVAPSSSASQCPAPKADQAVIYTDPNQGGSCRVLRVGEYWTWLSFPPVSDNAVSSIVVGSEVRAVLYERWFLGGVQTQYEGGRAYHALGKFDDRTGSIEIFRKSGGPAATNFLGDYPNHRDSFYSEQLNGLAHDDGHWFISTERWIYKVPLWYDLNKGMPPPGYPAVPIPLSGYGHMGDADVDRTRGYLYVTLEQDKDPKSLPALVAAFRTSDLKYVASAIVPNTAKFGTAPWVAFRRDPSTGVQTLWTSSSELCEKSRRSELCQNLNKSSGLREYELTWVGDESFHLSERSEVIVRDRNRNGLDIASVQGGVFNPEGTLLYLTNGYDCSPGDSVRVFDMSGTLQAQSEDGYAPFNFANHNRGCGTSEEAQGVDYFDVTGRFIPAIPEGQVHAILLDVNTGDFWNPFGDNDMVFIKHYDVRKLLPPVRSLDTEFVGGDGFALGNVSGDGRDEILIAERLNGGDVSIFDESRKIGGLENTGFNEGDAFAVGDVDGDRNDEIVVAEDQGGVVEIYELNGEKRTIRTSYDRGGDGFAVGDVDGDRNDEIIVAEDDNGVVEIYELNGDKRKLATSYDEGGDGFAVGDADGDGSSEIVVAEDDNGVVEIYELNGDKRSIDTGYDGGDALAVGDIDGDRRDEILVADHNGGGVVDIHDAVLNLKTRSLSTTFVRRFGPGHYRVDAFAGGDMDADGSDEILTAEDGDGKVRIHELPQ